jgi:hypothetical protein
VANEDAKYISFEEIEREHREERREDARRLAAGEITPTKLQEENSMLPLNAEVKVVDLIGTIQRAYDARRSTYRSR